MLLQSSQLANTKIISLHTGQIIGQAGPAIINPHDLQLLGFYAQIARSQQSNMVLLTQDIRQADGSKIFVDSIDEITPAEELVRHKSTFDINFQINGKPVRTASKKKLGKVEDYIINTLGWQIQKIYVKQPIFKSLSGGTLVIDRDQITEVNDKEVVVSDATAAKPALATPPAT